MKKLTLNGDIQYFYGMSRPVNVQFYGDLRFAGNTQSCIVSHVESILRDYVCTNVVGSGSERVKVKITVEWE